MTPEQHFTQPPARFTEASLIKDLEERGIGRPSTFVSIVSTIQDRGYVEQQERRFVPTWLGETVNELMLKHFPEIVDTNFTADMERRLDGVEEGKQGWTEFLKDFYTALRAQLERAEAEMDRVQKPVEEANEACPQCGKPLLIRSGRFGRFISCSGYPDCDFKKPLVAKTGALCPKDGGDLVERRAKRTGKVFYGCANYPACDFVAWDRPLTTPCPECGGLLTLANGKTEAHCGACGALVAGVQEGTPEVVGHRAPAPERPRRAVDATTARKTTTARKSTTTARKAPARKTTTARKTTARKTPTTTRASRAEQQSAAS
jgi:DNA topoisomerase-1